MTIGLAGSLIGVLISLWLSRKDIASELKDSGATALYIIAAIAIVVLFLAIEAFMVKPTQTIFFDDSIYQSMAQQLLISGKAVWCQFGTPKVCFSSLIYQEPIGTPFTLAIGFAVAGLSLSTAYNVMMLLGALSVLLIFLIGLLLFRDPKPAIFAELLMALTPVLLLWSRPTNSDLPFLFYSLIAVFAMLLFMRRKGIRTLALLLFSVSLLLYSKIDAVLFLVLIPLMYLILDGSSITESLRSNWKNVVKAMDNTKVLVLLLVFIILVFPQMEWAYYQFSCSSAASCGFGYQGTYIQNTCNPLMPSTIVKSAIDVQNLRYNVCSNAEFWLDAYASQQVPQPVWFTIFAIIGAIAMLIKKGGRRPLLALGMWFLVMFVFYGAFYAGSVIYGVDWRFMLSMIAQTSLLGGFAIASLIMLPSNIWGKPKRMHKEQYVRLESNVKHKSKGKKTIAATATILIAVLVIVAYSAYIQAPQISVNPSNIIQAPDARFYEGFVYNDTHLIPANCLVFTYDPTLFNINNRSATQMSDLYDNQTLANRTKMFSCMVLDYGYWCYTQGNICTQASNTFTLKPIVSSGVGPLGHNYTFYYIERKINGSNATG
jgi:4-amino-4-deoxy-L-arabinose transferase-like glycosyltransferase